MTQENKELLLKDLCVRLPYGIKASYYGEDEEYETLDEIESFTSDGYVYIGHYWLSIERIKPYLLPLSSMTKEQEKEWSYTLSSDYHITYDTIDWLNKNHFDYRGLIEKGLAIDATNLNIY